jgi:hypothetical protein
MPISPYLRRQDAFEPDVIRAMSVAFVSVCDALSVKDKDRAAKESIALKVIELARVGEHDPAKLKKLVLQQFNEGTQSRQPR